MSVILWGLDEMVAMKGGAYPYPRVFSAKSVEA